MMKITSISAFAALSAVGLAAHAAPGTNQPSDSKVAPPQTRIAQIGPSAEVLATEMTCGGKYLANIGVTNPGPGPMPGHITFTVGNAVEKLTIDPKAQKEPHSLTISHSKAFNCQAPLGLPKIEIFHNDTLLVSRTLTPKTFSSEKYFPQQGASQVWVRHMQMTGSCGQPAQGNADLFLAGLGVPQSVQADANFGGPPSFKPYNVAPNTPTHLSAGSAAVDCQGASGIPPFHTYLQSGSGASVILADKVAFTPG